jgi:hypothetical protein
LKETERHQRSFEVYWGLGPQRSLRAAALKIGVSEAAVKSWSKAFSWGQRVADREDAVSGLVRERTTRTEVDRRARNRQIVQAGIIATARAIADGVVRPTMGDLDRLVRLEEFVEGKPEAREEVGPYGDLGSKSLDELRALLRREVSLAQELESELAAGGAPEVPFGASGAQLDRRAPKLDRN